jgi:NADPH:quinone reductase-like Zn-dependent oxidoreductase
MSYPVVSFGTLPASVTSSDVVSLTHGAFSLPAVDAPDTLTAAQLLGYDSFRKNVALAANRALTLPSAASLVALLNGAKVGTSLVFFVTTGALGVGGDVVVTAGTGGATLGTMAVDTASQAQFRLRLTNVSSGSEAYQVQRLS